ncbi:Transcription factor jun-D [Oryzias melastigma]|uniref:Transcription factor JunD n=1 Tax=Oryzias melastigma TaxID=30732 RepID=A0A834CHN7_ORYME|nr:transcription factor jun-D [Oryzias melastigma]KAF6728094.1 Transcription factor jun-D [Oryzias melastigma]
MPTTNTAEVFQSAMMKEQVNPNSRPLGEPDAILNPPDLGLLKLTPPDLERLFIQSSGLVSAAHPPPHLLYYPKAASDEQEFAEGFVKALEDLHQQNQLSEAGLEHPAGLHPGDLPVYTTLNDYANGPLGAADGARPPAHPSGAPPRAAAAAAMSRLQSARAVKDEPQTVPDMQSFGESPPLSPIDMDNQERIKAERKKLRNRIAASKCRKRKLERISRLEDKVKTLKTQNVELASTASVLREQVAQLKQKVMNHVSSGCQLLPTQVQAY